MASTERSGWGAGMLQVLMSRPVAVALACGVGLHLLFSSVGLLIYRCPLQSVFALPCPGCGVSRAMLSLLRRDWAGAWAHHPFAPYFACLALLCAISAVLPEQRRKQFMEWALRIEQRTHVNALLLVAFAMYGAVRTIACALFV